MGVKSPNGRKRDKNASKKINKRIVERKKMRKKRPKKRPQEGSQISHRTSKEGTLVGWMCARACVFMRAHAIACMGALGQPLLEDVASGMGFLCGGRSPVFHR
jgi:hypothetical protein